MPAMVQPQGTALKTLTCELHRGRWAKANASWGISAVWQNHHRGAFVKMAAAGGLEELVPAAGKRDPLVVTASRGTGRLDQAHWRRRGKQLLCISAFQR